MSRNVEKRESMRGHLLRATGFFAVTLVPVTFEHLRELPVAGEVVDAVFSSLVFTLVFAVGGFPARPEDKKALRDLAAGAFAAVVLWGFLFVLWSAVPAEAAASLAPIALWFHMTAMFGVGFIAARI